MEIKIKTASSILLAVLLLHNNVSSAESKRGLITGDFNQEGELLFSAPMFKSYTRLDENNKPLKGSAYSKVIDTGRAKLKLLPGLYKITAICSGTKNSSIGETNLVIKAGKKYIMICSSKNGKHALIIKN